MDNDKKALALVQRILNSRRIDAMLKIQAIQIICWEPDLYDKVLKILELGPTKRMIALSDLLKETLTEHIEAFKAADGR